MVILADISAVDKRNTDCKKRGINGRKTENNLSFYAKVERDFLRQIKAAALPLGLIPFRRCERVVIKPLVSHERPYEADKGSFVDHGFHQIVSNAIDFVD